MRDIAAGETDMGCDGRDLIVNWLGGGEWRRQRGGGGGTRFVAAGAQGKVGQNFC